MISYEKEVQSYMHVPIQIPHSDNTNAKKRFWIYVFIFSVCYIYVFIQPGSEIMGIHVLLFMYNQKG